jgi:CheY-like chemotaxis protein
MDVQPVDLQDVVNAAVASVRHSAEAKNIQLKVVLDPMAGHVRGDPGRLQQCFWNLLSNSIKFTPKGGWVQISLERVSSHLEVCVVDNGQGIKPEFLPYVFERFRQADGSTTRRHGGLGLGLAIVKQLVELHGGSVRASSPGEGQGASFCIELPAMVIQATDSQGSRKHPRAGALADCTSFDHPSLEGISVLTVDDEPDARDLLRRILEECGARVFSATSAEEGLEILKRERPQMIISDIGMPDEDGYTFIKQVRSLKPEEGGRTPAAALTAFARAEDRTRALRAGYQSHLAKPVEATELTAVVASLAAKT